MTAGVLLAVLAVLSWSLLASRVPSITGNDTTTMEARAKAAGETKAHDATLGSATLPREPATGGPDVVGTPSIHDAPTIVLSVLRPDGSPAEGARVEQGRLRPQDAVTDWLFRSSELVDPWLEPSITATFTTDARGEVTLPWQHDDLGRVPLRLTAADATSSLRTTIAATAPAGSRHVRQLEPDRELRVQVLDAKGAPQADVEMNVLADILNDDGTASARSLCHGRTGSDGIARLPHAQQWAARIVEREAAARPECN